MFKKTPSSKPCVEIPKPNLTLVSALIIALGLFVNTAYAQNWDEISPASQNMLRPLRGTWEQIPPNQRQQWLQHVPNLQNMDSDQRSNAQERMAEWASLSSKQRSQVQQRLKDDSNDNANTRNDSWTRFLKFN